MPARPASSGEVSPPSVAPATQVTSSGFSSAPVAPVMASTHSRRRKGDAGWLKSNTADAQNQNGNEGSSPSSSGTQDEDIRSKSRPGSAGSQDSSSSKKEDAAPMDANRQKAVNATQFSSLSSGSAALLQLREHARNASPSAVNRSNGGTQSAGSGSGANRAVENVQKKLPPQTAMNAGVGPNQLNAFHGSRSASHEQEQNPMIPQDEEMNGDDDVDDLDDDPNTPPSPSERDVRIMFHGREIYAEDLIGLRVAKTFAGLGRFLGQVVKFDHRAALYTVVYADGDAEDLSIDGTLHILIQDEIERADPAQVPPAISLLFKKGEEPASPDSGDFMMQQPATQQHRAPQQRPRIQVSDREAQFVISLFENHALPSLVRQGWRVQTSTSGSGETRFVSPVREIFTSSLDVVGYIASNEELLASCFPANVHSAILSLLPQESSVVPSNFADTTSIGGHGSSDGGARKRTTSDAPSMEQFDSKRTRQMREETYGEASLPARGGVVRTSLYRPDDLDRRTDVVGRIPSYRGQGMAGRIHTVAPDRYTGGETTSEPRVQAPPELRGYRRPSSHEESFENPFASRWSNGPQVGKYPEAADYQRRFVDSPVWRERGDSYLSVDRSLDAHRNRARAEVRFPHRVNPRNAVEGAHNGTSSGAPTGYTYRDSMDSSSGGLASPMPGIPGYPQYAPLRTKHDLSAANFRVNDVPSRSSAAPRVSRETASFMSPTDTLGANAAFSMVDVDRISQSRSGEEQLRGRSPRHPDAQQGYQRRTGSGGHSYPNQRGNEDHYMGEGAPEPHNSPANAPSQQHD